MRERPERSLALYKSIREVPGGARLAHRGWTTPRFFRKSCIIGSCTLLSGARLWTLGEALADPLEGVQVDQDVRQRVVVRD